MQDTDLDTRLAAMEARVPTSDPPPLPSRRRLGRLSAPIAIAPAMVLLLVATAAAAGGAVGVGVGVVAQSTEGVQNPGQPLAGAELECMSPPEAQAYLTDHGFTDVIWQVESGVAGEKTGTSVQQSAAPEHGFVVPGAILGDGVLYMVVDQRDGATGVGACFDEPMP